MMLTVLATAVLAPAVYRFDASTTADYKVNVVFDGFLPVLGGNEGKAEVAMAIRVNGAEKDGEHLRASNEMTEFTMSFNGFPLPLTLENAVEYFPKTNVWLTPTGRIVKNDAPDKNLPIRLPGLDVKRFPDITYLPVELPERELSVGDRWEFKKSFGGADLNYSCVLNKIDGSKMDIGVKVLQEYTVFENDALEVKEKREDAVAEVTTTMNGTGRIVFDTALGRVVSVLMENKSVSKGENFVDKVKIERKLDSTLKVELVGAGGSVGASGGSTRASVPVSDGSLAGNLRSMWGTVVNRGQEFWTSANQWVALARMGIRLALGFLPGDLGRLIR